MSQFLRLSELLSASQSIFGQHVNISLEFLHCLDEKLLKRVYREQALKSHPDRAIFLGQSPKELEDEFNKLTKSYEVLNIFLASGKKTIDDVDIFKNWNKNYKQKYSKKTKTETTTETKYYQGNIPKWRLFFGQYLYFSTLIHWQHLIESIVWQKKTRPLVGRLAVEWGLLNFKDVTNITKSKIKKEKFGNCAVRLGLINDIELEMLLKQQTAMQKKIGQFFIVNKILDFKDLHKYLIMQNAHNTKILQEAT